MTIFNGKAEQTKYKWKETIGNIANSLFVLYLWKESLLILYLHKEIHQLNWTGERGEEEKIQSLKEKPSDNL